MEVVNIRRILESLGVELRLSREAEWMEKKRFQELRKTNIEEIRRKRALERY